MDGYLSKPINAEELLEQIEAVFLSVSQSRLNVTRRTLMTVTMLIRKRYLKVRMEEPEEFLKPMSQLS